MKRAFGILAALLFLLSCTIPAFADLIWSPSDRFYESLPGKTEIRRTYQVPEDLTVNLYDAPAGGTPIRTLQSGETLYVVASFPIREELWACALLPDTNGDTCWCRLGRLQLLYDHQSFLEEYSDSIEKEPDIPPLTAKDVQAPIPLWTYPNSGISHASINAQSMTSGYYHGGEVAYYYLYTANDGTQWGYITYFFGDSGWVYLNDLSSTDIPIILRKEANTVTDTSEAEQDPIPLSQLPVEIVREKAGEKRAPAQYDLDKRDLGWVCFLISAVAVCTALLILAVKHRK